MADIPSREELYLLFKSEVTGLRPELTDWTEGSTNDAIGGAMSAITSELLFFLIDKFLKTWLFEAEGTELEQLLIDHYGESFSRPQATNAAGFVTFSRDDPSFGNLVIPANTTVATTTDANGQSHRYKTEFEVVLIGTSISAAILAEEAGPKANVDAGSVSVIVSSLADTSVSVTNLEAISGGEDVLTDTSYREWAQNKLLEFKRDTTSALEATAKAVPGILKARAVDRVEHVVGWDPIAEETVGLPFKISRSYVYVSDADGEATTALVQKVQSEINRKKSAGTIITVVGTEAVVIDWIVSISLNPSGPNYATLSEDLTPILDVMQSYMQDMAPGLSFIIAQAEAYILSIYGPQGSDDIVDINTLYPTGDVIIDANQIVRAGSLGFDSHG